MKSIEERIAELREVDPQGRRSRADLERQATLEDLRADVEVANDLYELRNILLRLIDIML